MNDTKQDTGTTNIDSTLLTNVHSNIVVIRDTPVITDADVASLYGVETKRINEAVRNNIDKFPSDYMFALTPEEVSDLRSKFSSTKISTKSRVAPKVFTEKGLYMLATILKSKVATSDIRHYRNIHKSKRAKTRVVGFTQRNRF